ncbi:hypothetical protein SPRG_20537 [Saprolegnia parasitica CBS 223.65]|uniref:Protein N-terminal asparagine amidohydrolase n=1 Tax=Saprolegnia parasitica (strain CBS 223.65) TaxID=695850 RepID=A0A067C7M1_SAPPC|nr:hypothetical protein SPRG_20537 [Saprolegnia parasitica CBS 223.65]KDO26739.1 hypothetical protein SPRG_20537 [Saprolegnia parasitica CBS 223.65]|eukprot:XP_012202619.1 hypothetical protein SPRG_20537 [Saprolegnia parasitica CBS 223.65]
MLVTPTTTADEIAASPALCAAADAFFGAPVLATTDDSSYARGFPVLYVAQGEAAYSFASAPLALASDDATTCCILVLQSPTCFCLAHVDSPGQVAFLFAHWQRTLGAVDTRIAVVGGYMDEGDVGAGIIASIVDAMHAAPASSSIFLWATGQTNTVPGSSPSQPKVRGLLALPTLDGDAQLAPIDYAPGAYRGPNFLRRTTSTPATPLYVLKAEPALECVVGPYRSFWMHSDLPAARMRQYLAHVRGFSDAELLQRFSTSPAAEGPKFVADLKARFDAAGAVLDLSDDERTAILSAEQRYRWQPSTGHWDLVET